MKTRLITTLAIFAIMAGATQAAVLQFGNHNSNEDMPFDYGSNIAAAIADEFDISNGATPDVTLAWGPNPSANVLEFHNSTNWIAPMEGGKLQFDVDASSQDAFPPAPTVDFIVPAGISVLIDSVIIGHARDMHIADGHEPVHEWTINLFELAGGVPVGGPILSVSTTTLSDATQAMAGELGTGAAEVVNFDFTGDLGVSYRLLFDDGGDDSLFPSNHDGTIGNHPRAAIDNLTFRQQVPEPTGLALLSLGAMVIASLRCRS